MKKKQIHNDKKLSVKKCAYCGNEFYAKRNSAVYCSNTCKEKFYLRRTTTPQWYSHDPNEGKKLPPGTITSWEMPEDKLVFKGDEVSLYKMLSEKLSRNQLNQEGIIISNLKTFSETGDWKSSSIQVFTDENFMEVFRIFPDEYKLYVWPWDEDNRMPF